MAEISLPQYDESKVMMTTSEPGVFTRWLVDREVQTLEDWYRQLRNERGPGKTVEIMSSNCLGLIIVSTTNGMPWNVRFTSPTTGSAVYVSAERYFAN